MTLCLLLIVFYAKCFLNSVEYQAHQSNIVMKGTKLLMFFWITIVLPNQSSCTKVKFVCEHREENWLSFQPFTCFELFHNCCEIPGPSYLSVCSLTIAVQASNNSLRYMLSRTLGIIIVLSVRSNRHELQLSRTVDIPCHETILHTHICGYLPYIWFMSLLLVRCSLYIVK